MSIKGKGKELYVGKTECNIITFWGNKTTIAYEDLKRIDYCYCMPGKGGFINFIDVSGKIKRFEYKDKFNDEKIKRMVDLIHQNSPNLKIRQKEIVSSNVPNSKKRWVILLIMFLLVLLCGLGVVIQYYSTHNNGDTIVFIPTMGGDEPENVDLNSEPSKETEVFTTTLTAGHYIVGTDIPVGTYSFYSKKGTGNLLTDDGNINAIFDYDNQVGSDIGLSDFGTEELKNIPLTKGTIVTVTSTQEISAGCDDGLMSELEPRNQDLDEIELGFGLFAAGDDFPAGTYNVSWIEGNGNIQVNPYDIFTGINEIMGEKTAEYRELQELNDKLYIRSFNNLILNEGDVLEINDIKIKLTPSE